MSITRIYVVINKTTGEKRLVEATSQAQAIRHCVNAIYQADVASPKTVAQQMSEGLRIEIADNAAVATPPAPKSTAAEQTTHATQ